MSSVLLGLLSTKPCFLWRMAVPPLPLSASAFYCFLPLRSPGPWIWEDRRGEVLFPQPETNLSQCFMELHLWKRFYKCFLIDYHNYLLAWKTSIPLVLCRITEIIYALLMQRLALLSYETKTTFLRQRSTFISHYFFLEIEALFCYK